MKRSFNVFSSGIRFIPAMTASQFCKNDLRSSECSLTCNKSSIPYSAPASSLVLKYCSNMRSTWRPLTTRFDCASVSLNVEICLANSPFATKPVPWHLGVSNLFGCLKVFGFGNETLLCFFWKNIYWISIFQFLKNSIVTTLDYLGYCFGNFRHLIPYIIYTIVSGADILLLLTT